MSKLPISGREIPKEDCACSHGNGPLTHQPPCPDGCPIRLTETRRLKKLGESGHRICKDCNQRVCVCLWSKIKSVKLAENQKILKRKYLISAQKDLLHHKCWNIRHLIMEKFRERFRKNKNSLATNNSSVWIMKPLKELRFSQTNLMRKEAADTKVQELHNIDNQEHLSNVSHYIKAVATDMRRANVTKSFLTERHKRIFDIKTFTKKKKDAHKKYNIHQRSKSEQLPGTVTDKDLNKQNVYCCSKIKKALAKTIVCDPLLMQKTKHIHNELSTTCNERIHFRNNSNSITYTKKRLNIKKTKRGHSHKTKPAAFPRIRITDLKRTQIIRPASTAPEYILGNKRLNGESGQIYCNKVRKSTNKTVTTNVERNIKTNDGSGIADMEIQQEAKLDSKAEEDSKPAADRSSNSSLFMSFSDSQIVVQVSEKICKSDTKILQSTPGENGSQSPCLERKPEVSQHSSSSCCGNDFKSCLTNTHIPKYCDTKQSSRHQLAEQNNSNCAKVKKSKSSIHSQDDPKALTIANGALCNGHTLPQNASNEKVFEDSNAYLRTRLLKYLDTISIDCKLQALMRDKYKSPDFNRNWENLSENNCLLRLRNQKSSISITSNDEVSISYHMPINISEQFHSAHLLNNEKFPF